MTNDITEYENHEILSNFSEIENLILRRWNQFNAIVNLMAEGLKEHASKYLNDLSKSDKAGVLLVANYVNRRGYEEVARQVQREVNRIG